MDANRHLASLSRFPPLVTVIGGGPAGLVTALALIDEGIEPAVIETTSYDRPRFGEHLTPDAFAVLKKLRVDRIVREGGHLESPGVCSMWGSAEPIEIPGIMRAMGAGLHLERPTFEASLAREVESRGGRIFRGCRVRRIDRVDESGACGPSWRLEVSSPKFEHRRGACFETRFVVDGSGRPASLARRLGRAPIRHDTLIGLGLVLPAPGEVEMPLVESTRQGWWYTAPLPAGELVAIFFTDRDLIAESGCSRQAFWIEALESSSATMVRVGRQARDLRPQGVPAQSHRMVHSHGEGWLAVGDAAMAIDPLSSNGLAAAIRDGSDAGRWIADALGSERRPHSRNQSLALAFDEYLKIRSKFYRMERRWPDSLFWARRHRAPGKSAPIWLDPSALLRCATTAPLLQRTLGGIAPDLDVAWIEATTRLPMRASALASRLRRDGGYDDCVIIAALQALVEDGCLFIG